MAIPDYQSLMLPVLRIAARGETRVPTAAEALEHVVDRTIPRDARFRMYLGDQAIGSGKLDIAATHYRRVVEMQPYNAIALNNLAWVAQQAKDPAALRYAEQANRLAPGNPAFMDTLAMILLERGDSARAVVLLREATDKAPQAVLIRVNLARALARSGDRRGAQREYDILSELGDRGPSKDVLEKLRAEI